MTVRLRGKKLFSMQVGKLARWQPSLEKIVADLHRKHV